jgi:hypothetical protein
MKQALTRKCITLSFESALTVIQLRFCSLPSRVSVISKNLELMLTVSSVFTLVRGSLTRQLGLATDIIQGRYMTSIHRCFGAADE